MKTPGAARKRVQLDKAKTKLVAMVAVSTAVVVFSLVACKALLSEAAHLNKVAGEKEKALRQLKTNEESVTGLVEAYKTFASQVPNLLGGDPNGNGDRDGDNGKLILDALPSKYDFPALTTSLEKLLTGYTINSISGSDDVTLQQEGSSSALTEIPFTVNVSSNYDELQKLIDSFGRSIRPFKISSLDMAGNRDTIQTEVVAKTYYQPDKSLRITDKVVK